MKRLLPILLLALPLAACGQANGATTDEPVDLAEAVAAAPRELVMESPETQFATWTVADSGHAIHFANPGQPPLLTLDCRLDAKPITMAIIRHAPALPGQSALFAVMGNGHVSRLPAEPTLKDNEWRWEASLPASDEGLDLFIGPGDMRATLPGKGAIAMQPSRIPGEFVEWCRAGGETVNAPVEKTKPGETSEKA
ncbi:hypothetical protein D2V17_11110 [Aurantiacibacter xanthus]|uniref:Copper chaperone PCu(A)C n=1 Tax=Aurantiacibacter xanthus TaxID=1784712 RepID=A0A3A1P394_9SPHN|nr:hypothetical protein [Aurantiacibacter xanthus]RIV85280.1 hypothetical protein D2V17_11110 [Aurantiacibacter xanthus]